jgi:hypothetical protein
MAKHLVKELSWIDNRLVQAGEIIDGEAGPNLEKVTPGKKRNSATDDPNGMNDASDLA